MRYIDAFNHFFPKRIYELMLESPAGQKDLGKRMRGIPALYDVEERLRVVDSFPDYTQVICLGMPAIDRLTGPDHSPEWARLGNAGLAEMVAKYPDRFVGYAASLPMNAPEAAAKEAARVLANGANAIQLHTNVDGAPIDQDDPAASDPHPRDGRLPHRDQVEIRDLQRDRLAVRDRSRARAARLLRH